MKTKRTYYVVFGAGLVVMQSSLAEAGGFIVSETGSRYAGRSNAVTAVDDSATSVFYNPANLTRLEGLQIEGGMSVVAPSYQYESVDGQITDTDRGLTTPPNLALSYTLKDVGGWADLAFGVGVSVPYGSKFNWPLDWVGREEIQEVDFAAFEILPVIGFRPHEKFALGIGFRIMPMNVYLRRAVPFGTEAEGDIELAGNGTAFGVSASATVWPVEGLALSLAWRSPSTIDITGDANFTFPAPFDTAAEDQDVSGSLPLPQVFRFGAAYDIIPDTFNVSLDFQYQFWNRFEEFAFTLTNAAGEETVSSSPRNSMNSITLSIGGEFIVTKDFAIRAGYSFDQKTQPEEVIGPTPPDSNRHVIALGASYFLGDFGIHAHLADVIFADREALTSDLPGTWSGGHVGNSQAIIASLGLSVAFGGPDGATAESDNDSQAVPTRLAQRAPSNPGAQE